MAKNLLDAIFKKDKPEFAPNIFRNIPGRFKPVDMPVTYGISQSSFTLVLANTEYQIQGIASMSSFVIKARGAAIQWSLYEGQSNTVFSLLNDGQAFEISAIPGGQIGAPVSIYVRSTVAGTIVELIGLRLI